MVLTQNSKKSGVLHLLIVLVLLVVSLFFSLVQNKRIKYPFLNSANSNYTQLPQIYINQLEESLLKDSAFVYSSKFYENKFERQLVLINKNPTSDEFRGHVIVYVYPNDIQQVKTAENFNSKKNILDYTTTYYPVMYKYDGANYSVLKINLPFINMKKVWVLQHGVYQKYFKKPFNNLDFKPIQEGVKSINDLFLPIFNKTLNDYKISFFPLDKDSLSIKSLCLTKNKTLTTIDDKNTFWKLLFNKDIKYQSYIKSFGIDKKEVDELLTSLLDEKVLFNEVFDIEKLATYYALINLFSNNRSKKLSLLYNENTKKLEPFYLGDNQLGTLNTYIIDEQIDNLLFKETYTKILKEITKIDVDSYLNNSINLSSRIIELNHSKPELLFKKDVFYHNKLVIKKVLKPAIVAKVELLKINKDSISFTVKNLSVFPIQIKSLKYKKKLITKVASNTFIPSYKSDTIRIKLPRSFENLFVNKKTKTTGFVFEKDIFDLKVSFSIIGLTKELITEIVPYQPTEKYNKEEDLFRQEIDLSKYPFLTIDNKNKTIVFDKDVSLSSPLVLPKGYTVIAQPNSTIIMQNGGKIISHSPLFFEGSKKQPILFVSKDKKGQGLVVLAEGKESTLKYVTFDSLTNPSSGNWSTTSAVTFYESPVSFENCIIKNNTCEDAINVVRTSFSMKNCLFLNTQSDAFDGDFVTGSIHSTIFDNLGNDAIDVSGSKIKISNVTIRKAGDKGLSAGENSQMQVSNSTISDCEIAVAGKDLSTVVIDSLVVKNTKLGFTAYQKKPEFGPSSIEVSSLIMENVETNYLVENTSTLIINKDTIQTKQNDVKSKMYGVEFGVSSKKTRK